MPRAKPEKQSRVVRAAFEVEVETRFLTCHRSRSCGRIDHPRSPRARRARGSGHCEEEVAAGRIPAHDDTYFLVDPLDGTREFVGGGDDYTVNIGLIEGGVPKLGVVFVARDRAIVWRLRGGWGLA